MLIDTHSHIYLPDFDTDRTGIYERAAAQSVDQVYLPAIDSTTHEQMCTIEAEHPGSFFSMMGVHPCSVKSDFRKELEIAREYLDKRKFIAIGETGLDFYWDLNYTKEQYLAFHEQVEWALHYDLPLVIHSRNSTDECIQLIKERQDGRLRGVFHCFSGNAAQAVEIIQLGFYLGIGGVLTFKNSGLDKVIADISLRHVVLETDAPYLAPVPFRGKRNEPSYLSYVVRKLMDIKSMSKEEVGSITTENARKLFRK